MSQVQSARGPRLGRHGGDESLEDLALQRGRALLRQRLKARRQRVQARVAQQRHPEPAGTRPQLKAQLG